MDYTGQAGCEGAQEARVEEGFWNPGGRRRGGRGELQGPCNHCFAEGETVICFMFVTSRYSQQLLHFCTTAKAAWQSSSVTSALLSVSSHDDECGDLV